MLSITNKNHNVKFASYITSYNRIIITSYIMSDKDILIIHIFTGITSPGYNLPIFSISDVSKPATTAPPTGTKKFLSVD